MSCGMNRGVSRSMRRRHPLKRGRRSLAEEPGTATRTNRARTCLELRSRGKCRRFQSSRTVRHTNIKEILAINRIVASCQKCVCREGGFRLGSIFGYGSAASNRSRSGADDRIEIVPCR